MGKPLVSDELWELIQPLLPTPKSRRRRYPGRKPLSDRRLLTGILFVRDLYRPSRTGFYLVTDQLKITLALDNLARRAAKSFASTGIPS